MAREKQKKKNDTEPVITYVSRTDVIEIEVVALFWFLFHFQFCLPYFRLALIFS